MATNREQALWEWVGRPPKHGDSMLFGFIRGNEGSCAVVPVEDRTVKTYVDGTRIREYTFALQIMLQMSDADDGANIGNMELARTWQDYIHRQGESGDFPDFGANCGGYSLRTDRAPAVARLGGNSRARYDFYATIGYREEL